ncbi:insulinase family protein [Candidatus Roizmanbacteria bacterium]|nr:insulinase family protein [Candidatus Roizmanbacteria bacterium]
MVENQHTSYKLKEYEGDVDIFVPVGHEQKYLNDHGVELRRMDNGAVLAGATRIVSDRAHAQMIGYFPTGAFYEPVGKRGINHLVEHLISNNPDKAARRYEARYDAQTGHSDFTITLKGAANPAVSDYGIWPIIPVIFEQIATPLVISPNALESEKNVIAGEIVQRNVNHDFVAGEFYRNVLFHAENPINCDPIGKEDDLFTITPEEVQRQHAVIFTPQDMEVTVFSEGKTLITRSCMDILNKKLHSIKNAQAPVKVDEQLCERIHPDFQQGGYYEHATGVPQGKMTVRYIWLFPSTPFTAASYATGRFMDIAAHKAFAFYRENGLGYSCDKIDQWVGSSKRLLGFKMVMRVRENKEEFVRNLYPHLNSAVFGSFGREDAEHVTEMATRRLSALPVATESRFQNIMYGLRRYGRMIDADKLNEIDKIVTARHLEQVQHQLIASEPAMIVVSDS